MKNYSDQDKAKHLADKIALKKRNNMDYTGELYEAIEMMLSHSGEPEDSIKEYEKLNSVVLPADNRTRIKTLIDDIKHFLPQLHQDSANVRTIVRNLELLFDSLDDTITEEFGQSDEYELPEDEILTEICVVYEQLPGKSQDRSEETLRKKEQYFQLTIKYFSVLLDRLQCAIQEGDGAYAYVIGSRFGLQSIQLEQIYNSWF